MLFEEFTKGRVASLRVGDPVIITGDVEFQGKTGDVRELGRDGSFVVVDLYNYGPQSFQASDVSRNDYADSQDELAEGGVEMMTDQQFYGEILSVLAAMGAGAVAVAYDKAKDIVRLYDAHKIMNALEGRGVKNISAQDRQQITRLIAQFKTAAAQRDGTAAQQVANQIKSIATERGMTEGSYDPDAYLNPRFSRDYGLSGLSWQGSSFGGGGGGEPDPIKSTEPLSVGRPRKPRGTSAQLPADPFGRTTGKIPKGKPGQTFSQGTPDERLGDKKYALETNQERVGNMDADKFDDAMARLKKLAGAGPLKTVYDPEKRVYRNVPTAVQPQTQPKK
jgi:hypothetical protein